MNFTTLTEIIKSRSFEREKGIVLVKKDGKEKNVAYSELFAKSLKILGYLQDKGVGYKDELVIQLNDKENFIDVFWSGILGGIIPVPINEGNNDEHKLKFFKVWEKLNNPYLICDEEQYNNLIEYADKKDIDTAEISKRVININDAYSYQTEGIIYDSTASDIAFIQFSSGSTGDPKGVVLKHCNLIANIEAIIEGANIDLDDSVLTWMPMTHDMGLIGCHLVPITKNINQIQINTIDFIKRPTIWLEKASEHRATLLQSPNFGYRYILLHIKRAKLAEYDLSNVRLIFNGAEPISIDLCEQFLTEMNRYNLKYCSMYPVYGLAEACLAVAFPNSSEEKIITWTIDRRKMNISDEVIYLDSKESNYSATFVDLGYPVKHTHMRITNLDREVLGENIIGFIEIKGVNVTSGYYNMEEKTREVLDKNGWLNTGDLGFMRDGRLIVIGRYKDVLFLNGQNFYAHDIERIIREVAGIKLTELDVAIGNAIDYEKQKEEVVVFIVYKKKLEEFLEIEANIKREVNLRLGIQVSHVVPIKKVPKTTSGKVQRFNLIERFNEGQFNTILIEMDELKKKKKSNSYQEISEIEKNILLICKEYLEEKDLDLDDNFFEIGVSSISLNQIALRLQDLYGDKVKAVDFFANPTISKLAKFIKYGNKIEAKKQDNFVEMKEKNNNEEIAIIGISLKTANASSLEEYWGCIINGKENVKDFPENRKEDLYPFLQKEGYKIEDIKYHRACYLNEIDKFDYKYFKILPLEAVAMSPAQRLFLETALSSIEDSGYGGQALKGTRTGVYVGYIGDVEGYKYQNILKSSLDKVTPTGGLSSNIAGRVSYIMDFKGPSMMVDTACSSSLVALDLACNEIRNGSCDQAIVGGIRVKTIPINDGFRAGFESSDYRTKPFDEESDGTGEGEGVFSIVIKPLTEAINDKDNIYAVIKGSAVNHDGASMGLSAPNPAAQTDVILQAINRANVDPSTINYLEAHGTGTPLGDPVEIHGLTDAYNMYTDKKQFCAVGSVKANIGHLFEASGLASIVKCCLMLKNKKLPPLTNFNMQNKKINFIESQFYINTEATEWKPIDGLRRCGISNFGFSGTNAHVILEEFKYESKKNSNDTKQTSNIFTLTAKNKTTLEKLIEKYIIFIEKNKELDIADLCYTTNVGREHHEVRAAIITNSVEDLLTKLKKYEYKTNISEQVFYGIHKRIKGTNSIKKMNELNESDLIYISNNGDKLLSELDSYNRGSQLVRVAQIYTRGANLTWNYLYEDQNVTKIHIPTYEYEKFRCWPSFVTT